LGEVWIEQGDYNKNGVIIVRFDSVRGKEEVLKGGIYHFDNKSFMSQPKITSHDGTYVPNR